jgi:hypothetical protein
MPSSCTYFVPPRFPGKRGTSETLVLQSAPSTWTLGGPEVGRSTEPRPDPPKPDTQAVYDPGPQGSSVVNPRMAGLEPSTPLGGNEVQTPRGRESPEPEADVPPQTQDNPSSARRFFRKVKKFMKSKSFFFTLQIKK